ncbi:MAG: hypothetical protein PHY95_00400 [Candidatus ainarchaeum sp.]|nr:hypothetical protein [Candidatus ainarchaeum sp.]
MNSADIVAVLSLKSNFMKDVLGLCEDGTLRIPELFCDCTSGDDMDLNYRMLDILLGKGGLSTIGLLSINEDEATLFEMLLVRTDKEEILEANNKKKGLIIELDEAIKDGSKKKEAAARARIKEVDAFLDKGRKGKKDAYSAAHVLYEKTGVPLLMHTREGACIIGGDKSTGFVPSVDITLPNDCSLVGAGDTLCGAFATALAVKKRSDGLLPEDRKLSYEDCLLIANIATGYRLAKINKADKDDAREREWYEAVGKVSELYGWASARTAKRSVGAVLPNGVEFVDVEKNSGTFGGFSEMDSETLLGEVRKNCEDDYWAARVAFEELCRNPKHMDALVEIVKDSGPAGKIFGKKAVHILAGLGNTGVDALVEAISSMDEEPAFKVVSESVMKLKNAEVAAEIIFGVLCTGKLTDSFEKLMGQVTSKRFGRHVDIAMIKLAHKPRFSFGIDLFRDTYVIAEMRAWLSKESKNLDLVFSLGIFAQRACLELEGEAAQAVSSLLSKSGVPYDRWEEFKNEVKDICSKGPGIRNFWEKDAPGIREKLMREYALSNEELNNAVIVLLHTEHSWDWYWPGSVARRMQERLWRVLPWKIKKSGEITPIKPQHKLLWLLAPPYTEPVRDFALWYSEREMRVGSHNIPLPDKLVENLGVGGEVRDFYRKMLAICLVWGVVPPELTPLNNEHHRSTRCAPTQFYAGRVADIRKMMSQWPQEQPQAEAAKRAARECSRRERDHFMKPTRHKRRFEAAPERMNRMKRIV